QPPEEIFAFPSPSGVLNLISRERSCHVFQLSSEVKTSEPLKFELVGSGINKFHSADAVIKISKAFSRSASCSVLESIAIWVSVHEFPPSLVCRTSSVEFPLSASKTQPSARLEK